jgi:hypothetical protein
MKEADLFSALEEEMKYMPCESPIHDISPIHEGPGEWYISYSCPHCGYTNDTSLCCDRYKQFLPVAIIMAGDNVVQCSQCRNQFLYRQIVVNSKRREM